MEKELEYLKNTYFGALGNYYLAMKEEEQEYYKRALNACWKGLEAQIKRDFVAKSDLGGLNGKH